MCSNMTTPSAMTSGIASTDAIFEKLMEDDHSGEFQISYIYLATVGLVLTLTVSNLLSIFCSPPSANSRRQSLYSTLIWNIPFFDQFWSQVRRVEDNEKVKFVDYEDDEKLFLSPLSS